MNDRIGILERFKTPLPKLKVYYRQKRVMDFKTNKLFPGTIWKKALHPLLILALKLKRVLCGQRINVIGDKRIPTEHPVIYAATHIVKMLSRNYIYNPAASEI